MKCEIFQQSCSLFPIFCQGTKERVSTSLKLCEKLCTYDVLVLVMPRISPPLTDMFWQLSFSMPLEHVLVIFVFDTWYNTSMVATFCLLAGHMSSPKKIIFLPDGQQAKGFLCIVISDFWFWMKIMITPTLCCCWMMHRTFSCHQLCCRDVSQVRMPQDQTFLATKFWGNTILRQYRNIFLLPLHLRLQSLRGWEGVEQQN